MPNIALIQEFRKRYSLETADLNDIQQKMPSQEVSLGVQNAQKQSQQLPHLKVIYVGSSNGMEKQMISAENIPFIAVLCGKLRRYFSLQNAIDWFKIPIGVLQSLILLLQNKPSVIFSKGGYVSFPVAVAAWILRIPVVLHESDLEPGLANKITSRIATNICVSFEQSQKFFPAAKTIVTGNPVRPGINEGSEEKALAILGWKQKKRPVLLVMGGSQGSMAINQLIWNNLKKILDHFDVIHLCGEAHVETAKKYQQKYGEILKNSPGHGFYSTFPFVNKELKHFYALADIVVSRAGAISLAELSAVAKPALLIPLTKAGSRGEQMANAHAFVQNNVAVVMEEASITFDNFFRNLEELLGKARKSESPQSNITASEKIIKILEKFFL